MTLSLQDKYDQINRRALEAYPALLEEWFPAGKRKGHRFVVGDLGGDRAGESVSVNLNTGAWKEFSGGPGGYDAVGLFAHAKCCGDRKLAFKVLAQRLGVEDEPPPGRAKPNLKVVPKDDWKSQVPPPPNAGLPRIKGATMIHEYRMPGVDHPVRYVARCDKPDGKKDFYPHTYGTLGGETGWHLRHPNNPLCLYGLDRLDGRAVILQEGEKKTDQLQALLPGYACLGWSGGGQQVANHDFHPLSRSVVTVVGDAVDGVDAMMKAADIIHRLGEALGDTALGGMVRTVDTSMFPKGWDLGNAATGKMVKKGEVVWEDPDGPWSPEKIEAFIHENARLYDPDPGNVDTQLDLEHQEEPDDTEWKEEPAAPDKRISPPLPLGYDGGHYYYLSPMTGQIEVLARRSHTEKELIGIADLQWYWRLGQQYKSKSGGLKWDEIGNLLKGWCSDVGFYRPDKVRRRGACLDIHQETGEVRAVFNMGNHLLVNGESHPLRLPGSIYIYEAALPLKLAIAPPLTATQAGKVAELCGLFSWEKPIYGTLMAGWLAVAPICGALSYRPAIWVTGGSGSGKSTLEALIMKPLLGGVGLFLKGGTTEAGVRQKLGRDALPVMVDEAEAESQKAKGMLQGLLELNRQSSSEGGAEIVKGTQNQTGAKTYLIKSCFSFSGINPTLDHMADENRMSVLELMSHGAADRADFQVRVVDPITQTITEEFASGFVARSVWLMPKILENAKTFSKALAVELGSSRLGDQYGTLLAGFWSLEHDDEISAEDAMAEVRKYTWDDATSADAIPDERRGLNHLMQRRVRLDLGGNKFQDVTMAELVKFASEEGSLVSGVAQTELRRHGMKFEDDTEVFARNKITFEEGEKPAGVWISNTHTALKEHLKDTPWSSQWSRTLRRLPGVIPLDREAPAIRFAGELGRAVFVPLGLIV